MVNPGIAQDTQPRSNGMAVAGMVLGILALVLFWFPVVNLIVAILGVVFSVIGMRRANLLGGMNKGFAVAGLATAIVGLVIGVVMILAVVAIPAFLSYTHKSKSSEATTMLNRLGRHAKMAYGETTEFPKGKVGPTPAGTCCGQPNAKCPTSPADWNDPVWQELEFSIDEPTIYQFSYESDGRSFTATATGDADCDGELATYTLTGTIDASGNPAVTLTKPPPGQN
jgi:hypothetical protein